MYEDLKEYLNWYDTRRDVRFAKDAPVIGLVLQRSHLVTGDDGHYAGVVSALESRGAKVGLSGPIACTARHHRSLFGNAALLRAAHGLKSLSLHPWTGIARP